MSTKTKQRIKALSLVIEIDPESIQPCQHGNDVHHTFIVSPHKTRLGLSPARAIERVALTRNAMAMAFGSDVATWTTRSIPSYDDIVQRIKSHSIASQLLENNLHDIVNTIYFLCTENDEEHALTLREAFDGKPITDRTKEVDSNSGEYRVLTSKEAYAAATDDIRESLWAFTPEFVVKHIKLDKQKTPKQQDSLIKAIGRIQEELCEDANPVIEMLIDSFAEFVEHAIQADGLGHFLSPYDGEQHDSNGFFIYRTG